MPKKITASLGLDGKPALKTGKDVKKRLEATNINMQARLNTKELKKSIRPLGEINGLASEIDKSLAASNARVVAFGASVAIISGVAASFRAVFDATRNLETALIKIQAISGATSASMQALGDNIFKVARETGQSFEIAAEAALEFSRQGLSAEETSKRLKASMILVRTEGIGASKAVEGITAAINGFNESGLGAIDILNKLDAVSNSFAVSTNDLIESMKRSAAVAQNAGVSLEQLAAVTAQVQQSTARGGAVIGNAYKTIFTRLNNTSTINALEAIGVQTRDLSGDLLNSIDILKGVAAATKDLDSVSRNNIFEKIAGKRQIALLIPLLKDLSKENGVYEEALRKGLNATDEAIRKNELYNTTLDGTILKIKNLATESAAGVGKNFENDFKNIATLVENALISINDALSNDLVSGGLKALSSILSGPGLVIGMLALVKLIGQFSKFALDSVGHLTGMDKKSASIKSNQLAIKELLVAEGVALDKIEGDQTSINNLTEKFGGILQKRKKDLQRIEQISRNIAVNMQSANASGALGGGRGSSKKTPSKASGHLPAKVAEYIDIQRGVGGARRNDKPVTINDFNFGNGRKGTIVANTSEYLVKTPYGDGILTRNMANRMDLSGANASPINAAAGFLNSVVSSHANSETQLKGRLGFNKNEFAEFKNSMQKLSDTGKASAKSLDAMRDKVIRSKGAISSFDSIVRDAAKAGGRKNVAEFADTKAKSGILRRNIGLKRYLEPKPNVGERFNQSAVGRGLSKAGSNPALSIAAFLAIPTIAGKYGNSTVATDENGNPLARTERTRANRVSENIPVDAATYGLFGAQIGAGLGGPVGALIGAGAGAGIGYLSAKKKSELSQSEIFASTSEDVRQTKKQESAVNQEIRVLEQLKKDGADNIYNEIQNSADRLSEILDKDISDSLMKTKNDVESFSEALKKASSDLKAKKNVQGITSDIVSLAASKDLKRSGLFSEEFGEKDSIGGDLKTSGNIALKGFQARFKQAQLLFGDSEDRELLDDQLGKEFENTKSVFSGKISPSSGIANGLQLTKNILGEDASSPAEKIAEKRVKEGIKKIQDKIKKQISSIDKNDLGSGVKLFSELKEVQNLLSSISNEDDVDEVVSKIKALPNISDMSIEIAEVLQNNSKALNIMIRSLGGSLNNRKPIGDGYAQFIKKEYAPSAALIDNTLKKEDIDPETKDELEKIRKELRSKFMKNVLDFQDFANDTSNSDEEVAKITEVFYKKWKDVYEKVLDQRSKDLINIANFSLGGDPKAKEKIGIFNKLDKGKLFTEDKRFSIEIRKISQDQEDQLKIKMNNMYKNINKSMGSLSNSEIFRRNFARDKDSLETQFKIQNRGVNTKGIGDLLQDEKQQRIFAAAGLNKDIADKASLSLQRFSDTGSLEDAKEVISILKPISQKANEKSVGNNKDAQKLLKLLNDLIIAMTKLQATQDNERKVLEKKGYIEGTKASFADNRNFALERGRFAASSSISNRKRDTDLFSLRQSARLRDPKEFLGMSRVEEANKRFNIQKSILDKRTEFEKRKAAIEFKLKEIEILSRKELGDKVEENTRATYLLTDAIQGGNKGKEAFDKARAKIDPKSKNSFDMIKIQNEKALKELDATNKNIIATEELAIARERSSRFEIDYQENLRKLEVDAQRVSEDPLSSPLEKLRAKIDLDKAKARTPFGSVDQGLDLGFASLEDRALRFKQQIGEEAPSLFADNMSEAFSSVYRGAESFEDAMLNAVKNIADALNQRFTQNMFDNIFANFGAANGRGTVNNKPVNGYNSGGYVTGGSGVRDDVPAMMTGGEYVIKKSAVDKHGVGFFNQLNQGAVPQFAGGGFYGSAIGAGITSIASVLLQNRQTKKSNKAIDRELAEAMENSGPRQSGSDFFVPGSTGPSGKRAGYIDGVDDLYSFVNQRYTSGRTDKLSSSKGGFGFSLEDQSRKLSVGAQLGLFGGNIAGEVQSAKGSAFDLITQESSIRKQIKEEEKSRKKQLIQSLIGAGIGAVGSSFFGSNTGQKFLNNTGNFFKGLFGGDITKGAPKGIVIDEGSFASGFSSVSKTPKIRVSSSGAGIGAGNLNFNPTTLPKTLAPNFNSSGNTGSRGGYLDYPSNRGSGSFSIFDSFASGGMSGKGAALTMAGEYIMSPDAVSRYSPQFFDRVNSGGMPKFASGGAVGNSPSSTLGSDDKITELIEEIKNLGKDSSSQAPQINITIDSSKSSPQVQTSREEDRAMGEKIGNKVYEILQLERRPGGMFR